MHLTAVALERECNAFLSLASWTGYCTCSPVAGRVTAKRGKFATATAAAAGTLARAIGLRLYPV